MLSFVSSATMNTSGPNTKAERSLRILCLHGYCQNAVVFRNKVGALRKALARDANTEMIFVDAPHVVNESGDVLSDKLLVSDSSPDSMRSTPTQHVDNESLKRAWWVTSGTGRVYQGFDTTIEYLSRVIADNVG